MKKLLVIAFALESGFAFGITGAEAAALITSEPADTDYVQPETFDVSWTYFDGGSVKASDFVITIDNWQADIEAALTGLKGTVNTLAVNSFEALAKIAALKEVDLYLSARIDTLTSSLKGALSKLDEVKQEDEHGNQTVSKVEVHNDYVTLVGGGVPVDNKSVDFSGTSSNPNTPAPLEVKGFGANANKPWLIPHPFGGALGWGHVSLLADDATIEATYNSSRPFYYTFGLKGWGSPTSDAVKCDDTLSSQLLTGEGTHYVVTRLNSGTLHYAPVGKLSMMTPDGSSIVTNSSGAASLNGFADAEAGSIPVKGEDGLLWSTLPPVGCDGVSISTNGTADLTLNGFDIASDNAVPFKSNGVLVWGSVSSTTNRIVAGAGINVTDNGEGTLTISAKPLETESGATYQTMTVVTSVRYDPTTHKFQCKTRQITFLGATQAESGWIDVFEATSHKGEHQ